MGWIDFFDISRLSRYTISRLLYLKCDAKLLLRFSSVYKTTWSTFISTISLSSSLGCRSWPLNASFAASSVLCIRTVPSGWAAGSPPGDKPGVVSESPALAREPRSALQTTTFCRVSARMWRHASRRRLGAARRATAVTGSHSQPASAE